MSVLNEENSTIGYLGNEFQFKLIKLLLEDKIFFNSVYKIVHSRMFTNTYVQHIIGLVLDYTSKNPDVNCSYPEVDILIRNRYNGQEICEHLIETLNSIKEVQITNSDIIKETSTKFFKQQNLTKALFEAQDIIKQGSSENYEEIESIIRDALEINSEESTTFKIFENWEECLTKDSQVTIPTGYELLDSKLGGGIRKGELGIIIAPTGIGKAQPLHSKVLTPNGFITMGEVEVGMEVIGCDGKPHKVTGVYPQGLRKVYRIRFKDGSSCECDENHLWDIYDFWDKNKRNIRKTISTEDMRFRLRQYGKYHFTSIPIMKPQKKDILQPNMEILNIINEYGLSYSFGDGSYRGTIGDRKKIILLTDYIRKIGGYATSSGNFISLSFVNFVPEGFQGYNASGPCRLREVFDIVYVGDKETQCISVDSKEHTYITDDYIVTHNTSSTTGFCAFASSYRHKANDYKGFKVLQVFFEDLPINIKRKYLGYVTGVEACELHNETLKRDIYDKMNTDERVDYINDNIHPLRPLNGVFNTNDLRKKIKRLKANGFNPDLVIIDYFECLGSVPSKNHSVKRSEWSAEGEKMRQLEAICNEFGVAMWVATQGTKDSIGEAHIGLKHNSGSVQKSQIGHLIIALSRTEEQEILGKMNIGIPKQRVGRKTESIVNCEFNNGTCKFSDGDALGEVIGGKDTTRRNNNSGNERYDLSETAF